MRTEQFEFNGFGGVTLPAVLWLPDGELKKLVQIAHGMTEHIGRYTKIAEVLTSQGIAVAGYDLRGHGKNPGDPDVASFGEGGWTASLEDLKLFSDLLTERLPGVPHFMLGFSLGSFLLREYLGLYPDDVAGAIIIGTGYQPGWLLSVMEVIVNGQIRKVGFDGFSPLVRQLSFGTYNQHYKPNRTEKDWLCSDNAQLDLYLADPFCRANSSAGLFVQMLGAMKRTGSRDACRSWKKDMPVLLISGLNDAVGNMGKGVVSVKKRMDQAGINHVTLHLLPDARHDVLHEEASGAAENAREIIAQWLLAR